MFRSPSAAGTASSSLSRSITGGFGWGSGTGEVADLGGTMDEGVDGFQFNVELGKISSICGSCHAVD